MSIAPSIIRPRLVPRNGARKPAAPVASGASSPQPKRAPETRGERVIAFIERYCRVPEGMHVGQPLLLDDFQKKFILDVYDNPHGTSLAILSMGRKNGKTALIASLMLAHLVGPEAIPNSQIVSGAMSREQASLVFKLAEKIVHMSPRLSDLVRVVPSRKMMVGLPLNVEYEALSAEAKTKFGLSPVLAILDEMGQVRGPTDPFVDAITTAQGAHKNPLLIVISTQAASDGDMLSLWIDDALNNGDPHTVCHLYVAPPDCDLTDESAWRAANPALGSFRSLADVRKQAQEAKRMPSKEPTFRNLILNQRVEANAPFVSRAVWKMGAAQIDESLFTNPSSRVFAAIDLSARIDLTALVLAAKDAQGRVHIKPYFWAPEEGLRERAKRDRAPYDVWAKAGFLIPTPGAAVDYSFVAHQLGNLVRSGVPLYKVGYDRWRIDVLKKYLDDEVALEGLDLVPFGQGYKDFSPALDKFEELLVSGKVVHGEHPVLTMCAMNSVVRRDEAGNRKLDKKRSTGRIDGMVAATMAVGLLESSEIEAMDMLGVL